MNRSFEEYFVSMAFTPASFEQRFRSENLDAEASKLWFRGEVLVGLVLVARRGWNSRVAGMGLVVAERGKGYGKVMLQAAIDEATVRSDRNLLLEVFTANEPARRLYERLGFRNTRLLTNFQCPPKAAEVSDSGLLETDPREVARLLSQQADGELPWMLAPETLAAFAPPIRAFQLENKAFAVVREDPARTLFLCLLVPRQHRRQGWGSRLMEAIEAAYSTKNLLCYLVPEGTGYEFLKARQWAPQELTLWEMVRPL
ncbi:GNAT family N-acetyltransferase [Hymenobacter sp. ASUV-10]|uniref:GNAT family N-acetyltransferase n=1 Tax=Hymenobacter aranciens TaxID=3063996 RepID=A0ABT9B815_9BACT|nr:GNAT family N-acetyltransferase [Hymenobacter sp. ASUV-10]MDO7873849.1 GNAT family N-acetyltransferase [Hymenobacter sp. ASUV-10]